MHVHVHSDGYAATGWCPVRCAFTLGTSSALRSIHAIRGCTHIRLHDGTVRQVGIRCPWICGPVKFRYAVAVSCRDKVAGDAEANPGHAGYHSPAVLFLVDAATRREDVRRRPGRPTGMPAPSGIVRHRQAIPLARAGAGGGASGDAELSGGGGSGLIDMTHAGAAGRTSHSTAAHRA